MVTAVLVKMGKLSQSQSQVAEPDLRIHTLECEAGESDVHYAFCTKVKPPGYREVTQRAQLIHKPSVALQSGNLGCK